MSLIKSSTLRKLIKEAVIKHLLSEIKKEDKSDDDCKDCDKPVSKSSKSSKTIGKKPYRGQKVDPMSLHKISGTSTKKAKAKSSVSNTKSKTSDDDEPKEMRKFGAHYDDEAYDLEESDYEHEEAEDEFED